MESNNRLISSLSLLAFIFIFSSMSLVSADVDTVILQLNGENQDYAVIGRTYDLAVAYEEPGHTPINNTSNGLQLISSDADGSSFIYEFIPGNTAGTRTFGEGANQFQVSVLSEADELIDSVGDVTIEITDHSSSVKISDLDLSNRVIRMVDVGDIADLNIDYDLDMGLLLKGFTFDLDFAKGNTHPDYNNVKINSSTAITVVENLLIFNGLHSSTSNVDEINNGSYEILNNLLDKYDANIEYGFNAQAVKQGNDFTFSSDEGYADLNSTYLENIQTIIEDKVKFIDPDEVVNALLPLGDFSEFKQFVDFDISVNTSSLRLEDGSYTLSLIYEDKYGNTGEMPFIVILEVTNEDLPQSEVNGTVEFTSPVISQTLDRIENLPSGISITAALFGKNKPSGSEFANAPSNINSLNYLQINSSNPSLTDNGAFELFFKIAKSSIPSSARDDVRLYVQEGTSWILLPTTFASEDSVNYEYVATLPHFSNFLIGYVSQSGGGSNGGSSSLTQNSQYGVVLNAPNQNDNGTINLGGPSPEEASKGFFSAITGAIIGALGSPGGIAATAFIVIVIAGLMMGFRRRKNEKSKKRTEATKLNSRGDKIGEI